MILKLKKTDEKICQNYPFSSCGRLRLLQRAGVKNRRMVLNFNIEFDSRHGYLETVIINI